MKRVAAAMAAALLSPPAAALTVAPSGGPVVVTVSNVRESVGRVRVSLCSADHFMKQDCEYAEDAPAVAGSTVVMLQGVAPGVYAAQVYHDKNGNGRIDRGVLGIPLEGFGFSRDAPIGLRGPKFAAAAFRHTGQPQEIAARLRHYR